MENHYLQTNSQEQRIQFYKQNLFDNNQFLKKMICYFVLFITVYSVIEGGVILPREVTLFQNGPIIGAILGIVIFLALFYFFIFKLFKTRSYLAYLIRYWLVLLGVMAFACYASILCYQRAMEAIQSNNPDRWYYYAINIRKETWICLLIDILVPVWYMKLIIPFAVWTACVLSYYHGDLTYKVVAWEGMASSMVCLIIIWGIKGYSDWKSFILKMNADAWNEVHKCIIDKIPNSIAIVDEKEKVFYSNSNFKALCNDDLRTLSGKLTQIKRIDKFSTEVSREPKMSQENEEQIGIDLLHTQISREKDLTLIHLIELTLSAIRDKGVSMNEYITFTASLTQDPPLNTPSRSYEIKIGPLAEYNKIILILDDTTQRDLAVSLKTANHYKDKLLATVSHDLRAPINGSISFIESTLHDDSVPSSVKEQFLVPAQRSCQFLLHLVNDIVDFSQINANKIRMNFESSSLINTIKNCHQLLELQAEHKKIDFVLELDPRLPKVFTTDHNRVAQIIINLLTNAIKFTFDGGVRLSVQMVEDSLVKIQVSDTGLGIKEEDQKKLFQEFTRIEYEQTGINTRGVGLGLVIANNLAGKLCAEDNEKGRINVVSEYGQGSRFYFFLEDKLSQEKDNRADQDDLIPQDTEKAPLRLQIENFTPQEEDFFERQMSEAEPLDSKSTANPHFIRDRSAPSTTHYIPINLYKRTFTIQSDITSPQNKKETTRRALVVDDDPLNVLALQSVLRKYNITLDSASNGRQAIQKVLDNVYQSRGLNDFSTKHSIKCVQPPPFGRYQLIFMDSEMPIMDGFETTATLISMMKDNKIGHIPIVGYTGHVEEEVIQKCLASGMADVIGKPPQRNKLTSILERFLSN